MDVEPISWLLLIHQVPNSPAYLRVKMWRRLQRIGAVAVKNAVYALPKSDQSLEDLHWVAREIIESGGEASVCEATFVEGLTNRELVQLFHTARDADYAALLEESKTVSGDGDAVASGAAARIAKLRERLSDIQTIDFFSASGRKAVESAISQIEAKLRSTPMRKVRSQGEEYLNRTWVTRKGIHVDRIASAWLIQRFIDPDAKFKYVPAKGYRPLPDELCFDMFDAEFTHEGDRCTFEVFVERLNLSDRGLSPIGEIIHDIDLKESKFGRPETAGIALVIAAICTANREDPDRLARGSALFDDLYEFFRKR